MVQHNTLTDPELHEPKGAATASNGSVYVSNGAGSGAWTSLSALTDPLLPEPKDVSTANAGEVYIADGLGSGAWGTIAASAFTESFTSATLTVSSAGIHVVPHLMAGVPFDWTFELICTAAEFGYSVGERIKSWGLTSSTGGLDKGVSIAADATNLDIKFGLDGNVFNAVNKTTGADEELSNGSWDLIVKAWR